MARDDGVIGWIEGLFVCSPPSANELFVVWSNTYPTSGITMLNHINDMCTTLVCNGGRGKQDLEATEGYCRLCVYSFSCGANAMVLHRMVPQADGTYLQK